MRAEHEKKKRELVKEEEQVCLDKLNEIDQKLLQSQMYFNVRMNEKRSQKQIQGVQYELKKENAFKKFEEEKEKVAVQFWSKAQKAEKYKQEKLKEEKKKIEEMSKKETEKITQAQQKYKQAKLDLDRKRKEKMTEYYELGQLDTGRKSAKSLSRTL